MTVKKSKKKKSQKGFAKAFKHDIGRESELIKEEWEVQPGRSILMNPTRQKIFRYLCEYPCSSLSSIARDFGISPASMTWHLKLLSDRKLISEDKVGGQRLLYPRNFINPKMVPVFALLANQKILNIFNKIRESPGITQKDLTKVLRLSHQSINSFTNRLRDEGLINIIRDGKFTRYYSSQTIDKLEISQRKKLKEFRKWIIKSFKIDGVNPKLIRVTDKTLFIQITSGMETKSLKLSANPFRSITQSRQRFLAELL